MIKSTGFTLLEVLVAMVILSITATSVWQIFGLVSKTSSAIEGKYSQIMIYQHVKNHLKLISFEHQRRGEIEYLDYNIQWQAEEIRSSLDENFRRQPEWVVTYFAVNVNIYKNDNLLNAYVINEVKMWPDPIAALRDGLR